MHTKRSISLLAVVAAAALLALTGCKQHTVMPGPHKLMPRVSYYKAIKRQRDYWPTKGWKTKTPAEVGLKKDALEELTKYAFTRTGDDKNRKGTRTDGLIIIKNGYLVFEKYARGYNKDKPHLTWSMSKSFVNTLYGIAVKQGKIKMSDKAAKYYKPLQTTQHHKAITLQHLLNMTPSLFWNEGYEQGILKSSVLAMLYASGRKDMAAFTASFPAKYTPGTHFYYSSGTTNLAVGVLRAAIKADTPAKMESFIWNELFDPIGMQKVTWQRDGAGNVVGSSFLFAPPRQLAKFGYLYLNDGMWEGKRLLPKGWVKFSTTVPKADPKGRYGAHFWLNAGREEHGVKRRFPEAPRDLFYAGGHWGQQIIVIPSLDVVAVILADNRDKTFKRRTFVKLLVETTSSRSMTVQATPRATPPTNKKANVPNAPRVQPANQNQPTPRPTKAIDKK
jgi:CubicO group peptidase (beta-lactamase class C family)